MQYSPNGRAYPGYLTVMRPGKMRFDYHPPATLEVVSDGRNVAVRDRKLNTQDIYPVSQTPLKFLLQPKIDVARDTRVIDLQRAGADIHLTLQDQSTFGGTSVIELTFSADTYILKEWTVTDAQGGATRVVLTNPDTNIKPDPNVFSILANRSDSGN